MTGPKGINWTEAFQFYCETIDGRLPSYQDVANKFGVSKTEVGQRALEDNWIKIRQELYENGKNEFLTNKTKQIAEAESSHLTKWRTVQELADTCLDDIEKNLSLKLVHKLYSISRIMKVAIEGERTVLGLPNTVLAGRPEQPSQSLPELSPELIQEIDRLFEINSHVTVQPL